LTVGIPRRRLRFEVSAYLNRNHLRKKGFKLNLH
jgi:hypothetical protein